MIIFDYMPFSCPLYRNNRLTQSTLNIVLSISEQKNIYVIVLFFMQYADIRRYFHVKWYKSQVTCRNITLTWIY